MLVEIVPVTIPERLNREELVLTNENGQVEVREGDHWAGPLPDELRQILADILWSQLEAADVYLAPVVPSAGGPPLYRLALRIERFEATPGHAAVVAASWTARRLPQGPSATCRANVTIPLPDRSAGAAAGALAYGAGQLAQRVAASLGAMDRGSTPACPSEGP